MNMSQQNILDALDKIMYGNRIELKMAKHYLIENQENTIIHLCDLLPNLNDKQQWNIIRILTVMNDQRAIPALIDCLHHSNNAIVSASAQLLGILGGDQSLSALVDKLDVCHRNNNTQVMISLVKALGSLHNQQVVQKIIQVMHETSSSVVRYTAIIALMEIGNNCATNDISKYVHNEDHHVRTYAIQALDVLQRTRHYTDPSFVSGKGHIYALLEEDAK